MTEPLTSEEIVVKGFRCRFNLASDLKGWVVVGPVHTDHGALPFFHIDQTWATRQDALKAVEEQADRVLFRQAS